jgi:hypothetical protein
MQAPDTPVTIIDGEKKLNDLFKSDYDLSSPPPPLLARMNSGTAGATGGGGGADWWLYDNKFVESFIYGLNSILELDTIEDMSDTGK